MQKVQYITEQTKEIDDAITRKTIVLDNARAEFEACNAPAGSDEHKERAKAVKSAVNRIGEDSRLLRFFNSEPITNLLYTHRVDFATLCSEKGANTRECKKRLNIVLTAISTGNAEDLDKAEFRYFGALAAGRLTDSHTLEEARDAMSHEGVTQARYMRSFLHFIKSAKQSDTKTIVVDRDSAMMKKILGLFA